MRELTFNITEDKRYLVEPTNVENFNLTFDKQNWVQGRVGEDSLRQVFVNVVTGPNNEPYDLTGINPEFDGLTPKGGEDNRNYAVIDNHHSVMIDAQGGRFRFDFPREAFAIAGSYKQAFFSLKREGTGEVVATLEFDMKVMANFVYETVKAVDYITPFDDVLDQLLEKYKQGNADREEQFNQFITNIQTQYNSIKSQFEASEALADALDERLKALETKIEQDGLFTKAEADEYKASVDALVADRLAKSPVVFKTVADLASSTSLADGSTAQTQGYYAPNDGGGATYVIKSLQPAKQHVDLANGKFAELVYDGMKVNVRQFGVNPSQNDNYEKIQDLFNRFIGGGDIYFPNGTYKVSQTLTISGKIKIRGDENTIIQKTTESLSGYSVNFNQQEYDYTGKNVLLIVGPQSGTTTNTYIHDVAIDGIQFISANTNSFDNQGLVVIGSAYMTMDHCQVYGFSRNIEVHNGFGFRFTDSISTGAKYYALSVDNKAIHCYVAQSSLENITPMQSCIRVLGGADVSVVNTALTMTGVAANGEGSSLRISGSKFESGSRTISATGGGRVEVINCDIERHQDAAVEKTVPIIYCVDGSTVVVRNSYFYWDNYSGQETWDTVRSYTTNTNSTIVVTETQFVDFPEFNHYDGGASLVVFEKNFSESRLETADLIPGDGIQITGSTLQRRRDSAFLNVGFKVLSDTDAYAEFIHIPATFKPYEGLLIIARRLSDNALVPFYIDQNGNIKNYTHLTADEQYNFSISYMVKDWYGA